MAQYNEDELEPPSWMDERFLIEVLSNAENDKNITISEYIFSPGSNKGDHFGSCMYRVALVYKIGKGKEKRKTLIIKTEPEAEGFKKAILKESVAFDTEIKLYSEILPQFSIILREHGDNTTFGPRMPYSSVKPRKVLVFEDLVLLGFKTINRMVTFEESKSIVQKLAKFHAIGFKLNNEGYQSIRTYTQGVFDIPDAENTELFTSGIPTLVQELQTLPEFEQYTTKLEAIKDKVLSKCFGGVDKDSKMLVLNHGDFHLKNIMFKLDEKEQITESILLDYQMSKFGSAVFDLIYSLYMVVDFETRYKHRDEHIYYYHTQFVNALNTIGYKGEIPSLRQLLQEVADNRHLEIFLVATFLPFLITMTTSPKDINSEDLNDTEARRVYYKNPLYHKELKAALPYFLHKGYLDDW